MFDFSFGELMVIGVVALVVIGPERLPKVARTAGILVGRMQRYVAGVKADINREMSEFDQLKDLKNLRSEVESAGADIEAGMRKNMADAQSEVQSISNSVGSNMARGFGGISALGQASIETASSEHAANQVSVSVPEPIVEPSPQMELQLDSAESTQESVPAKSATGNA